MKKYVKTYFDYFDYTLSEDTFVVCECCKQKAVDIHHLKSRGMGFKEQLGIRKGSNNKINEIENLVALCRTCHTLAESDREFNEKIKYVHLHNVKTRSII
jgi:thymidine kinase